MIDLNSVNGILEVYPSIKDYYEQIISDSSQEKLKEFLSTIYNDVAHVTYGNLGMFDMNRAFLARALLLSMEFSVENAHLYVSYLLKDITSNHSLKNNDVIREGTVYLFKAVLEQKNLSLEDFETLASIVCLYKDKVIWNMMALHPLFRNELKMKCELAMALE